MNDQFKSFRPLIGVSFCKLAVLDVDGFPMNNVSVPLSGLVSVNYVIR